MTALTERIFSVEGLDWFRLRFDTDAQGRFVKITGLYQTGRRDESPRD